MGVRGPPAALVVMLFLTTCYVHGFVGGRDRRQATESTPTGPIKSFKQFVNLTKLEAEKQELPAGFGSYDFPEFEKTEVLDRHNLLRRTPAARNEAERNDRGAIKSSDMEHMSWDTDLAYMALQWARGCDFSHGQPPNVSPYENLGQNLWAYTGTADEPRSGVRATQDWYDEVSDYYYREQDGGSCSNVCGHYTQVVWASTNKVGCGRYFCPTLGSAGLRNAWYVICNYAPAGNFYGLPPYAIGSPCTECASGVGQCYNDLCRLCSEHSEACDCRQTCVNCGRLNRATCSCTCPDGYYGSSCSKQCIDTSYRCYNTWWPQFCADYPDVREGCPQMCDLCNPADPDFVCDPTNQTPAPPNPPVRPTSALGLYRAPVDPALSRPAVCDMKFSAATYISSVLYLFSNDLLWRVRSNGRLRSPGGGELVTDYFPKLPNKVSCAYELQSGDVVFVKGKKMFKYTGTGERNAVYTLSSLGLPRGLTGAIHVSSEGKTYFFKGSEVYAFNERTRRVESGYPRDISEEFPGVPNKIISAFSDVSGNKYFVRSKKVFKISSGRNNVDRRYPQFFTDTFITDCAK